VGQAVWPLCGDISCPQTSDVRAIPSYWYSQKHLLNNDRGKTEEEAAKVHGLALCNRYIHLAPAYDDRLSGRIWGSLWDPCDNCRVLIGVNKGNILNFGRLTGSVGAPP
jgi:hypothetical protein